MKNNVTVYIGRFQPPHRGHVHTASRALERANRVIVVIGSHNSPRTIINPWTAAEREAMFRACLSPEDNKRIEFVYAENRLYSNAMWARNVERQVNEVVSGFNFIKPVVSIIGNGKGDPETDSYINLFKQWKRVPTDCVRISDTPLNATKLRELMFTGYTGLLEGPILPGAYNLITEFVKTPEFAALKTEYDDGIAYEKMYANVPYNNMNFYTVDSVVIQSGHVLLVQRGQTPGRGLWALPGGHVNQSETAEEASIRELYEETKISVPRKVLEGSLFCEKLFDHPDRSLRARITKKHARTVDVAFGYKLDDAADLPRVVGSDDAAKAWWFTFDEVANMRAQLFEDHADIIEYMLARVEK